MVGDGATYNTEFPSNPLSLARWHGLKASTQSLHRIGFAVFRHLNINWRNVLYQEFTQLRRRKPIAFNFFVVSNVGQVGGSGFIKTVIDGIHFYKTNKREASNL